jgi:hypothetical protein
MGLVVSKQTIHVAQKMDLFPIVVGSCVSMVEERQP